MYHSSCRCLLSALLIVASASGLRGQGGENQKSRRSALALSKRLHVNPLIAEPDTMEFEWGGSFSAGGAFTLPATIRYTPRGPYVLWGRTEFSVGFDSLAYDGAARHFSDRATFGATCVVHDGEKLDFAIEPIVQTLFRGDSGTRLGGIAISRYDAGRSSAGVTLAWSSATRSSPSNPAGTWDVGAGYGFQLKDSGPLSHLTPHTNFQWERSTGTERQISVFEGIEYQITETVAIDFSAQHVNVGAAQQDRQVVVGLTVNTRHFHKH